MGSAPTLPKLPPAPPAAPDLTDELLRQRQAQERNTQLRARGRRSFFNPSLSAQMPKTLLGE